MAGLGTGVIGLAFCSRYGEFIGVTTLCGVCLGVFAYNSVRMLIDMYGVTDKFQDAYGLVMLAKMMSTIFGPPIGGILRDLFGDYKLGIAKPSWYLLNAIDLSQTLCCPNYFNGRKVYRIQWHLQHYQ